jgi:hypothetical protein
MGSGQMAEEHGDEMGPAGEPSGMAFSEIPLDRLLEFMSRKGL